MKVRIEWGKTAKPEDEVLFNHLTGSKRVHLAGPGITYDGWYKLEEREASVSEDVILDKAEAAINRLFADNTRSLEATRQALVYLRTSIDVKLEAIEGDIQRQQADGYADGYADADNRP